MRLFITAGYRDWMFGAVDAHVACRSQYDGAELFQYVNSDRTYAAVVL